MTSFTEEQQAFIQHQTGNALCIAGAGSGKTTTLVALIKTKLNDIQADKMLVMMFNRDIKTDFKEKLQSNNIQGNVPVHTFHSFCFQVLRESGFLRDTGYQIDFQNDDSDKSLAKHVLRNMSAFEKSFEKQQTLKDPKTHELLLSFIGLVKAYMLPPQDVFEILGINGNYKFIIEAYRNFETLRKEKKKLFFDDWLVETVNLMKNNDNIREFYNEKFRMIIVDEFQDLNNVQHQLLKLLIGEKSQLIAVGDIDQSIYCWRGSAPQFMLDFEKDFTPAKRYSLSHTFRFGHSLALAANQLIVNNKQRFQDFLTVSHGSVSDTSVDVIGSTRQVGEIADSVRSFIEGGGDPREVAILVRRWSQTLMFELAFLTKNIPYQMPIPSVLSHSREVRLLIDLMRLATRQFQQEPLHVRASLLFDLMCFPHCFVPNKQLRPMCDAMANMIPSEWLGYAKRAEKTNSSLKLDAFIERLDLLTVIQRKGSFKALEVYKQYRRDSRLDNWIWKTEATASEIEEAVERLDSIETVLGSMDQNCEKALQYFEYYTRKSNHSLKSTLGYSSGEESPRSVQITTIFRAKGREYSQVYLPFWDKDAFPYVNRSSVGMYTDVEEERRLAYVAVTRAKDLAKIYYTIEGSKKGVYTRNEKKASQFVLEAKVTDAQDIGPKLYGKGELPFKKSQVVQAYYKRLERFGDMQQPKSIEHDGLKPFKLVTSEKDTDYSYEWALSQPKPDNAEKVIHSLVKTKTVKYLETELARILRELQSKKNTQRKILENRLIVVAIAKRRKL